MATPPPGFTKPKPIQGPKNRKRPVRRPTKGEAKAKPSIGTAKTVTRKAPRPTKAPPGPKGKSKTAYAKGMEFAAAWNKALEKQTPQQRIDSQRILDQTLKAQRAKAKPGKGGPPKPTRKTRQAARKVSTAAKRNTPLKTKRANPTPTRSNYSRRAVSAKRNR